jgi:hypothetical protein
MSTAAAETMARASIVCRMLPATCPVSTEARAMAIVRKRAMIPSVMSMAIEIAVPWAAPTTVSSRIPGMTYARYASRPPVGAPRPAPSVPPNTYTNSSRNTTGRPAMNRVSDG